MTTKSNAARSGPSSAVVLLWRSGTSALCGSRVGRTCRPGGSIRGISSDSRARPSRRARSFATSSSVGAATSNRIPTSRDSRSVSTTHTDNPSGVTRAARWAARFAARPRLQVIERGAVTAIVNARSVFAPAIAGCIAPARTMSSRANASDRDGGDAVLHCEERRSRIIVRGPGVPKPRVDVRAPRDG